MLDRFWWSTWVYGIAGGVSQENLTRMISIEKDFWDDIVPDCLFLLRRSESENESQQQAKLSEEYGKLAKVERQSHPIVEIQNDSTIDQTLKTISDHLNSFGIVAGS